ncbi:MAG: glycoside hydrolase family 31 protein [Myxococcales bacterium]|nr:glycoside hydrolase family 31 protein [Myxococcales bacterium]
MRDFQRWLWWCALASCTLVACNNGAESEPEDTHPPDVFLEVQTANDGQFPVVDVADDTTTPSSDMVDGDALVGIDSQVSDDSNTVSNDIFADSTSRSVPQSANLSSGNSTLLIDAGERSVTLVRDGDVRLRLLGDGFLLGELQEVVDSINYDPYPLFAPEWLLDKPPVPNWLEPIGWKITAATDTSIQLNLDYGNGITGTVLFQSEAPDRFSFLWVPLEKENKIAYLRIRARVDESEGFYGLGEWFDRPEHRGTVRAMQMEPDLMVESAYNEAHVPIPFLIGTRGWGWFVESLYPGVFVVATEDSERVDMVIGPGLGANEGLKSWIFTESHPLDVTRQYYDITGKPVLPAPWALGPWVWRDENEDQAQVESDIETIRALDLATVGYWIDRPYATAVNTFDFHPAQFPDPQQMIQKLKALGFRTALWHTPYLDEKSEHTQSLRDIANQSGYYPPTVGLIFNGWGRPIDVTLPAAVTWWKQQLATYIDLGINGFKLDYGEDVVPGAGPLRNIWKFADGSDERTMHMRFQPLYHGMYADLLPAADRFLLCRAARFGEQTLGLVIWPGDLDANFAWHKEKVTKPDGTTYNAVGGLPASIIAGLSLGPSGFPFYGADTGGYRHTPPNKELFTRWFQQTALSTVMQIGMGSSDVAWEYTPENGFDDEMLDWYRTYTRLHLRLFPLLWTYAHRLLEDGRPIQRPLGLAFPDLGFHPQTTYMLGDDLLVAPVVQPGVVEWEVVFPEGQWVDWWTGEMFGGPQKMMVDAPLWKLPLYIRQGGVVPLLRPTIDTLVETDFPETIDSFANDPGKLWVRVVPGQGSNFVLYDDTVIAQNHAGEAVIVSVIPGELFVHGAILEVWWEGEAPTMILDGNKSMPMVNTIEELDGLESGWMFGVGTPFPVRIQVGPGNHTFTILTL